MNAQRLVTSIGICTCCLVPGSVLASDLSFTFMDFQYSDKDVEAAGSRSPVPGQTVRLESESGDGIGVGGSLALGNRFFINGRFESSIIDVAGEVESPLVTTPVSGDYDLVTSSIGFGYRRDIGENADLMVYGSYDTANYDFGSFAGENFDIDDSGAGAGIGIRWNPTPSFEIHSTAHYSPVAEADLSRREYESDALIRAGVIWYFFGDLGLGLDYESGPVDSVMFSMRFSFGDLAF